MARVETEVKVPRKAAAALEKARAEDEMKAARPAAAALEKARIEDVEKEVPKAAAALEKARVEGEKNDEGCLYGYRGQQPTASWRSLGAPLSKNR